MPRGAQARRWRRNPASNPHFPLRVGHGFLPTSAGADWDYDIDPTRAIASPEVGFSERRLLTVLGTYDPTNGANSDGDIWRASRLAE